MLHLRQETLAPSPPRASADTQPANDAVSALAPHLLERMGADGAQWMWDVMRNEIVFFVRDTAGCDVVQPTLACTLNDWLQSVAPADRPQLRTQLLSLATSSTRSFEAQFRVTAPDGRPAWIDLCGVVLGDSRAASRRIVAHQRRLLGAAECKAGIWPSPFHDPLTGLPNRSLFARALSRAVKGALQDAALGFAVLFIDLDGFKTINDRHGHLVGDHMLQAVSHRFSRCVRPEDMLARRDGDEFTILVTDISQPDAAVGVAERVLQQLRAPLSVDGAEVAVTASIGIALNGTEPLAADDLVRAADEAMYQAKARGGDCYVLAPHRTSPA